MERLYAGDAEFVAATARFIREGVAREDLLQLREVPDGTVARLHMRLA